MPACRARRVNPPLGQTMEGCLLREEDRSQNMPCFLDFGFCYYEHLYKSQDLKGAVGGFGIILTRWQSKAGRRKPTPANSRPGGI